MATLRRTPTGRPRWLRRVPAAAVAAIVALVLVPVGASPALAEPVPPTPSPPTPTTAAEAQKHLDEVLKEAEALTEQWHAATDDLNAKREQVEDLQAAVGPAQEAAEKAKADEEAYRREIDVFALSTLDSNLDQFSALLDSHDPQEFLDQMSALHTLAADHKEVLDRLLAVVETTRRAVEEADAAVKRAQAAVEAAEAAEQELAKRKREAEIRIDEAEKLLDRLSPAERRARTANGAATPALPSGSSVGLVALRAAATQVGKPYIWGASGPNGYDCSGLTSWAFKQAGVTLPRSSSAQATVGRPVSWDELQPGDLVFYYNPVSHVGIYAGNGLFINAPESGDVVKFQKVNPKVFSGARRL
ncbi:Cell wall-associated hydrolase, NlpC family [Pseudonocardia thermophila]|uniref:Cell wall-associated hydrolase, NlpC family n=1 Tax=Pseudonocardia thermophila TaxID=1848 RepID=A0A1M6VY32_PSETH|nr:Cell wall-associated hydrolase, NlpC family [Pseudonocardia thermophila]